MPSLRQISISRSAQDVKAPIAQIVTSCQRPPSRNGAKPSPYFNDGGSMEIWKGSQVGPIAADQKISNVPNRAKKIDVTPKNPT